MASRALQQLYAELLDRYGRRIADAFLSAVQDIRARADLARITKAVERGDIEAALEALNLDAAAYGDMLDAIAQGYTEAGQITAGSMPKRDASGLAMVIRFDGRNPAAEAWLREHSAQLVTRTIEDQRQAVRQALNRGMILGQNPRAVGLDIVGRVDRVSGKRSGGLLGLSAPQEAYLASARAELASEDPADLRHYLTRARRDRRFDRSVTKAIREGRALDPAIAAKASTAYSNRLLALRGETIGRVEAMTSLQRAKRDAFAQAIESGKVAESAVRKTWRSAGDIRVRDSHRALNGDVAGFNEAFVSPSGARLLFPMDTSLGAGVSEIANCRCDCAYRIDFLANLR